MYGMSPQPLPFQVTHIQLSCHMANKTNAATFLRWEFVFIAYAKGGGRGLFHGAAALLLGFV